jgi:hypothetical protein
VAYALLSAGLIVTSHIPEPDSYGGVIMALIETGFLLATPWLSARIVRERARRAEAFRALAVRVERERVERGTLRGPGPAGPDRT